MLKRNFLALTTASLFALTGCSSIFSTDKQEVEIVTNPEGASLTITNRSGEVVYSGVTPFKEELLKAESFFKGEIYHVHIEKGGFRAADLEITSKNNAWYVFGNTLNGFVPGWVGVDPKTHTLYELDPPVISIELVPLENELIPISPDTKVKVQKKSKRNVK